MRRSNCFVFAWYVWLIRWQRNGYIALRRTNHIIVGRWHFGWHWMIARTLRNERAWLHYAPKVVMRPWYRGLMHKLWYRGTIKRGDVD